MGKKECIEGSGWAALLNNIRYPSTIRNPGGVRYSKGFRLSWTQGFWGSEFRSLKRPPTILIWIGKVSEMDR